MSDIEETKPDPSKFNFFEYPENTLFFDRREGRDRRDRPPAPPQAVVEPVEIVAKAPPERRARKERRRRVDPTTFEKQYSDDEIEFMNAVQEFKNRSGKSFPSHGDVLRVAASLGYRKSWDDDDLQESSMADEEMVTLIIEPCLPT